jgi:hypothetical protein
VGSFLLSVIIHPPSVIIHPPSVIIHPPSVIIHPPSVIIHPPSVIIHPPSVIHHRTFGAPIPDRGAVRDHFDAADPLLLAAPYARQIRGFQA